MSQTSNAMSESFKFSPLEGGCQRTKAKKSRSGVKVTNSTRRSSIRSAGAPQTAAPLVERLVAESVVAA
jgi:hypothetical protein